MKKTLYMDKESIDILEKMPEKKQSDYTRKAIKEYYYNEMTPKAPEPVKSIPKIEVKWHNGKN